MELETDAYKVDRRNGGPEYEALAAFGTFMGINDIEAICRANELCGLYSLDPLPPDDLSTAKVDRVKNQLSLSVGNWAPSPI